MAKSKLGKKKNEGKKNKKSPSGKNPTKPKNGNKLKQKATNKYNSKALESIYGSITRESNNWGKRTRAMRESALEDKPYDMRSNKRQRPSPNSKNDSTRKPPPPNPQFQLRMPKEVPAGQIPWWKKPTLKPSKKKIFLLDEIKVDPQAMSALDQELEAFSKYVQLSPKEIETRENLIRTIRNEARERFGIRDSDVKVFGSYAARSVCTFESDVDLVIWGLVESEQSWNSETEQDDFQKETAQLFQTKEPQSEHPNMKKQHRILKWKAALDEYESLMASQTAEKADDKAETRISKCKAAIDEYEKEEEAQSAGKVDEKSKAKSGTENTATATECHEDKDDSDTAPTASNSESPLSEKDQFDDGDEKSSKNDDAVADDTKDSSDQEEPPLFVIDRVGDESLAPKGESSKATANASSPQSPKEDGQALAGTTNIECKEGKDDSDTVPTLSNAESPLSENDQYDDADGDDQVGTADAAEDSDDDTADKLEGLHGRAPSNLDTSGEGSEFHGLPLPDAEGLDEGTYLQEMRDAIENGDDDEDDDEQEEDLITTPKTRSRSHSLVSLSSATTCSDNQMVNEDGLEVSFVTDTPSRSIIARRPQKLTDDVRLIVNSKLNQLCKRIRRTGVATSIELRKWARVPILNMKTRFGYECDIGVGGHNGNDTSAYAGSQISQHPSFAPVVMVLKILLNQHDLDKPFTGGLGSFKLYVLVASHIQQHLTFGGSDTPSEILLTFFYRYGGIRNYRLVSPNAKTDLTRVNTVKCHDGGVVEVSQVFQIENCVAVFRQCWWTLIKSLSNPTTTSLLQLIVDVRRLRQRREAANSMVSNTSTHHRQTQSQIRGHVSSLVRYSTNHHENKAIAKLFKGGGSKPFKKKYRGVKRKST